MITICAYLKTAFPTSELPEQVQRIISICPKNKGYIRNSQPTGSPSIP